jgi:DHA2 family multidrug resistance protein
MGGNAPAAGARPPVNKWVVAGTVLTGTIMAVLDSSIVNVALPHMRGTFGATVEQITWVATGYILANVIIMPLIGLLSVHLGRKHLYMASVAVFTVASMLAGMARSLPEMIVFRIIQGAGGGAIIPISQAILRESFPFEEQGTAMGLYGLGVVLAPAFGPTLGGWLTDTYSWPWVFYVNVPIGVVNIFLVSRFIHDPPYMQRRRGIIDVIGLSLLMVGLGSLQLMLEKGQEKDWFSSDMIVTLAVLAAVGLVLFVWRELKVDHPAVNIRLLRNIPFTSATAIGGVLGMGLYGSLFILPLFLQQILGYPAFNSGLALMPRSLAMGIVMPISGRLYNRLGPRFLVGSGLLVSAWSFWSLGTLSPDTSPWSILAPQIWQGVGFGLIFVALSTAALAPISKRNLTEASGLYNVVRQVFGSVGIALAATVITGRTTAYHLALGGNVTPYNDSATGWLRGAAGALTARGMDPSSAGETSLRFLDRAVTQQASILAYNHAFMLVAGVFLVCLPMAFLLHGGVKPEDEREGGGEISHSVATNLAE